MILLQAVETLRDKYAEQHRLHWQIKDDIALAQESKIVISHKKYKTSRLQIYNLLFIEFILKILNILLY